MPAGGLLTAGVVAGSIGSSVIGGIMANSAAGAQRDLAIQAAKNAMGELNKVGAPPEQWAPIIIEKLKQVGVYNPQMEKDISVGISKVSQIQEDSQFRNAQISALQDMKSRAQGGLTQEDVAGFNKLKLQVAADVQGKMGAINQEYASRGLGGGGQELASKLSEAQSGENRLAQAGDDIAAARSMAAQNALAQFGSMASQIRGQEFGQKYQQASAADAFKQFDTANSINAQMRNTQAQNQAQMTNLAQAQEISNANVQAANQELYRQAAAREQNWQDQLALASAKAGAQTGMVAPYMQGAQQQAALYTGMGAAGSQAIGAGANFYAQMAAANKAPASTVYNINTPSGGNTAANNMANEAAIQQATNNPSQFR